MIRTAHKITPELRAAMEDTGELKQKTRLMYRAESNSYRRDRKREATRTKAQRSAFMRAFQARLALERAKSELAKRIGQILNKTRDKEQRTVGGIVIPSGEQVGKVLTRVGKSRVG